MLYTRLSVQVTCYVGRTHSYFNNRRKQHLETDRNSSIFSHLKNSEECKALCSNDAFRILDEAKTDYELALKESMHIKWRNPSLNIQKKHVILKLLVWFLYLRAEDIIQKCH